VATLLTGLSPAPASLPDPSCELDKHGEILFVSRKQTHVSLLQLVNFANFAATCLSG